MLEAYLVLLASCGFRYAEGFICPNGAGEACLEGSFWFCRHVNHGCHSGNAVRFCLVQGLIPFQDLPACYGCSRVHAWKDKCCREAPERLQLPTFSCCAHYQGEQLKWCFLLWLSIFLRYAGVEVADARVAFACRSTRRLRWGTGERRCCTCSNGRGTR